MNQKIDISLEILKSYKGSRSSAQISKLLGYTSNQFHRWESGHSVLTWNDLFKICSHFKVDLQKNLEKNTVLNSNAKEFNQLVKFYIPQYQAQELAQICEVSNATMSRWLSGKNSPPAEKIFFLIQKSNISFSKFVSSFFNNEKQMSAALIEVIYEENRISKIFEDYPWADIVLELSQHPSFQSLEKSKFSELLSAQTKIDTKTIFNLIEQLESEGAIAWSKTENKYLLNPNNIKDISGEPKTLELYTQFWLNFQLNRIKNPDYKLKGHAFHANLCIPKDRLDEFEALFMKFIHQSIALSDPKTESNPISLFIASSRYLTPVLKETHDQYVKNKKN